MMNGRKIFRTLIVFVTFCFIHTFSTSNVNAKDQLYLEIEKRAKDYEIQPSDAKIDKVWKAIPGYNGLTVDVRASYEKMKKDGKFDEKKLVYKQVSPNVHLKDLPPSPIYKGHPEKPMVALLVNVAWGNEYLSDMLATLKKHKVYATFFLEGRWVKENSELAKMIATGGHEIGNHSYSHPDMKTLPTNKVREELEKTNAVIKATIGKDVQWFAPPSGSFRNEVVKIAHDLNMRTIMWSVDTIDWQNPAPHVLIQRVLNKVHPGAMILMHPTEASAKSLETLIIEIRKKGLHFGKVSDLMDERRIITNIHDKKDG